MNGRATPTSALLHRLLHPSPYLLLTLCSLFWAGNWVVGRAMRHDIAPIAMGFWRWVLALIILLPFVAPELRRSRSVIRRDGLKLMTLGVLGATVFNTMIYIGLRSTTATNGILFNSISPVMIVLLSWALWRERLTARQGAGVALSLLGVVAIVVRADPALLAALRFNSGDLWLIAAMLLWSMYTLLLRWRPPELSATAFLTSMLLMSLPLMLPLYAWELATRGGFSITIPTAAALVYYSVFPSILAYLFWNRAVSQVGANRAGLFFYLIPVFVAVLSTLFLRERMHAHHFIGAGLIFGGIWLTTRKPRVT